MWILASFSHSLACTLPHTYNFSCSSIEDREILQQQKAEIVVFQISFYLICIELCLLLKVNPLSV